MVSFLVATDSLLWRCVWQTTVCLSVGGILSYLWARRPARAHLILILAVIFSMVTPVLSQIVYELQWGILEAPVYDMSLMRSELASGILTLEEEPESTPVQLVSAPAIEGTLETSPENYHIDGSFWLPAFTFEPRVLLIGIWLFVSLFLLIRLLVSVMEGLRMVSRASLLVDPALDQQINELAREFELKRSPKIFLSEDVHCPQIWSWFKHPALLLPKSYTVDSESGNWRIILRHELAHLKRGDHVTALISELLTCLFPWQLLAWWVKGRIAQFSEHSCDDWVLAGGESPVAYAELLLSVFPKQKPVAPLIGIINRKGFTRRIHHILRNRTHEPRLGRRWVFGTTLVAVCTALLLAFFQTQTGASEPLQTTEQQQDEIVNVGENIRQVWKNLDLETNARISRDGKYITCPDRIGNLELIDLTSGEKTRLTQDGVVNGMGGEAWSSILSPDNSQVVYVWCMRYEKYELRIVGQDGTNPRTLYRSQDSLYAEPIGWSMDGKHILAYINPKEDENQLVWLDVNDGTLQPIKTWKQRWPLNAYLSPDERYIACTMKREDGRGNDMYLIEGDGGIETSLFDSPGSDERLLGWSPDRKCIVFSSIRNENTDVFILRVEEGKPFGQPQLVKSIVGSINNIGISREGNFYYIQQEITHDVYTASFDNSTSKIDMPNTPISNRFIGNKLWGSWSNDGQHLIYRAWPKQYDTVCILSPLYGREREIHIKERSTYIRWSPDGQSLLTRGYVDNGRMGIFRINTQTGAATTLIQEATDISLQMPHCCSSDGKIIYYFYYSWTSSDYGIVAWDVETKQRKELYHVSNLETIALSNDGQRLAFVVYDSQERKACVYVISTLGGEAHEILKLVDSNPIGWMEWMPDGRHLLYTTKDNSDSSQLWKVTLDEGGSQNLFTTDEEILSFSVHPTGQQITLTIKKQEIKYYVMENFLPKE